MNMNFHYIVRGIIRDEEHLLLCKQINDTYTFLLGGHIDFGEQAKVALAREIQEEIGATVTIGNFRGAIENAWDDHCEISLVFETHHSLSKDSVPLPASPDEEHLEFLWIHQNDLANNNLLPTPLIDWLQEGNTDRWASTVE
jgi:8-oxo-dGTP diphosphatase